MTKAIIGASLNGPIVIYVHYDGDQSPEELVEIVRDWKSKELLSELMRNGFITHLGREFSEIVWRRNTPGFKWSEIHHRVISDSTDLLRLLKESVKKVKEERFAYEAKNSSRKVEKKKVFYEDDGWRPDIIVFGRLETDGHLTWFKNDKDGKNWEKIEPTPVPVEEKPADAINGNEDASGKKKGTGRKKTKAKSKKDDAPITQKTDQDDDAEENTISDDRTIADDYGYDVDMSDALIDDEGETVYDD